MSIIVWIFNWICWLNQCCCCDFLHNPINKRLAWWICFTFLLGILACCISAFVSVNRFGFAIEGTWCALYRIYYDTIYGQLTKTNPKWIKIQSDGIEIKSNKIIRDDFGTLLNFLNNNINGYYSRLKAMGILSMIYFSFLLIAVTFAAISMMFYACLKRQGYLITFMHVLWNIIRFFIFSFFLFGTAYGILFLIFRDFMAVVFKIFEEDDKNIGERVLGNGKMYTFFHHCMNCVDNKDFDCKIECKDGDGGNYPCDCSFIITDIQLTYRVLSDASDESRKLCALSLCSAFFGAISIYFFLLVLHHYNNELFFDSGKSIFKGFSGFGGGFKKINADKDPAYKKRKLRAEMELTSKNDDNNYNDINKNEKFED